MLCSRSVIASPLQRYWQKVDYAMSESLVQAQHFSQRRNVSAKAKFRKQIRVVKIRKRQQLVARRFQDMAVRLAADGFCFAKPMPHPDEQRDDSRPGEAHVPS